MGYWESDEYAVHILWGRCVEPRHWWMEYQSGDNYVWHVWVYGGLQSSLVLGYKWQNCQLHVKWVSGFNWSKQCQVRMHRRWVLQRNKLWTMSCGPRLKRQDRIVQYPIHRFTFSNTFNSLILVADFFRTAHCRIYIRAIASPLSHTLNKWRYWQLLPSYKHSFSPLAQRPRYYRASAINGACDWPSHPSYR